MKNLWGWPRGY